MTSTLPQSAKGLLGDQFRFVKRVTSTDNTISGNGLYALFICSYASEQGVIDSGIVFDLLQINNSEYAYTCFGNGLIRNNYFQSVSNRVATFSTDIPAYYAPFVYKLG